MTALNPELQRNVWLELSLHRLIAAPIILGLIFVPFWSGLSVDILDFVETTEVIYLVLVLLWGTRRAASTVTDEIEGRTWDGQRLSALGAWSMTWGKLLGSTAFVWYCAFIVLAVGATALAQVVPLDRVAHFVLTSIAFGLFAQAASFLACLALLRRAGRAARGQVTVSQLFGLAIGLWFLPLFGDYGLADGGSIPGALISHQEWYGLRLDRAFALTSLLVFLGWLLLGCYRLMRLELQYRARPRAWLAFLIFVVVYCAGFGIRGDLGLPALLQNAMAAPVVVMLLLVYLGLFTEPRTWMRQRAFLDAIAGLALVRLWSVVPLWLLSYLALAASVILLFLLAPPADGAPVDSYLIYGFGEIGRFLVAFDRGPSTVGFLAAVLLFVLRDALLVLLLSLGDSGHRGDLAALVYLACLYVLSGALVGAVDLPVLLPLFYPTMTAGPVVAVVPAAFQVALLALLVRRRWRARIAEAHSP